MVILFSFCSVLVTSALTQYIPSRRVQEQAKSRTRWRRRRGAATVSTQLKSTHISPMSALRILKIFFSASMIYG